MKKQGFTKCPIVYVHILYSHGVYSADILLSWGKDEASRVRWSGCSTFTCVMQDSSVKSSDSGDKPDSQGVKSTKSTGITSLNDSLNVEQLGVIHLANAGKLPYLCNIYIYIYI